MKPGEYYLVDFGWGDEVVLLIEPYPHEKDSQQWAIYTMRWDGRKIERRYTTMPEGRGKPCPEDMAKDFFSEMIAQGLLE